MSIRILLQKLPPATKALIVELADDLRQIVQTIEQDTPVTKGHYDKYMAVLSNLTKDQPSSYRLILGAALVQAGADEQGVKDAMRLLGYIKPRT